MTSRELFRKTIAAFGPKLKRALPPFDHAARTPLSVLASFPDASTDKSRSLILSDSQSLPHELPSGIVGFAPSPSNTRLAYLIQEDSSEGKNLTVEVWEKCALRQSCKVTELHGPFITSEQLGGLCWSADEQCVLYTADRKKPPADAFTYEEDLGEQFGDLVDPHIVVFSLESGTARVLRRGTCPVFSPAALTTYVYVVFPEAGFKLGLAYYTSRPSEVRLASTVDATLDQLVSAPVATGAAARSPRFSSDGTRLAFLSTKCLTHNGPCELCVSDVPFTAHRALSLALDEDFPGLYVDSLVARCFSPDARRVYCTSLWCMRKRILGVVVDSGEVQVVECAALDGPDGVVGGDKRARVETASAWALSSASVLAVSATSDGTKGAHGDVVLVFACSPSDPGEVFWQSASGERVAGGGVRLGPVATDVGASLRRHVATRRAGGDDGRYDSLLLSPGGGRPQGLVVCPHGGPHGANTTEFSPELVYLSRQLDAAVLLVNYRGSVGYARKTLESLPGRVGEQDVLDVHEVVEAVARGLGTQRVAVVGGSHGGFLAAHLSARFPDVYRVAVLRNPVVNMASMSSTSDIPDWTHVEALGLGCALTKSALATASPGQLKTMFEMSPVARIAHVKCPTLVHLGTQDRRAFVATPEGGGGARADVGGACRGDRGTAVARHGVDTRAAESQRGGGGQALCQGRAPHRSPAQRRSAMELHGGLCEKLVVRSRAKETIPPRVPTRYVCTYIASTQADSSFVFFFFFFFFFDSELGGAPCSPSAGCAPSGAALGLRRLGGSKGSFAKRTTAGWAVGLSPETTRNAMAGGPKLCMPCLPGATTASEDTGSGFKVAEASSSRSKSIGTFSRTNSAEASNSSALCTGFHLPPRKSTPLPRSRSMGGGCERMVTQRARVARKRCTCGRWLPLAGRRSTQTAGAPRRARHPQTRPAARSSTLKQHGLRANLPLGPARTPQGGHEAPGGRRRRHPQEQYAAPRALAARTRALLAARCAPQLTNAHARTHS
jgi:acylaminoacyl-peptidase